MVKGDPSTRRLYAQVILFNTYYYVVNMCETYDGAQVDYHYRYDVLEKREIPDRVIIPYNREAFLEQARNSQDDLNKLVVTSVRDNLSRILQIAEAYQAAQALQGVVSRSFDKAIEKYPAGTVITQEVADDVHNKVFAKVAEFLRHIRRTVFE